MISEKDKGFDLIANNTNKARNENAALNELYPPVPSPNLNCFYCGKAITSEAYTDGYCSEQCWEIDTNYGEDVP